ncbi:hypothetical protein HPB52_014097 [Rhipicephalus sanguineus]|uniref:Uncharacterized protein n=1 Tax=Rhipicephalus sanguineus TaxID=34632 RepID=A0A9D4PH27_RHISA|nr:hypothetical protein HPB52_014097 [Rhipicephalus sanguineus]
MESPVRPVSSSAGSWMLTLSLRHRELDQRLDLDLLLDRDRPAEQERHPRPLRPREEEALSGFEKLSSASTR